MKYVKNLEKRLAEHHESSEEEGYAIPEVWKEYPLCYLGYGNDRESCVREGSISWHDEVCLGIIDIFYAYYASLARMLESKHKLGNLDINVTVMPSYEDRTYVVVTYKKKVLLEDDCKAWNFCWENPTDLAELNDAEKKSIAKAREYLIKQGICARDGSGESNVEALFLQIHRLNSELVGLTAEQCLHLLDDSIGRDQYAIAVWHIEDVESLAQERDKKLTKKQAKEVIKQVDKHQDAELGISWDTLDSWIGIVLAEAKKKKGG